MTDIEQMAGYVLKKNNAKIKANGKEIFKRNNFKCFGNYSLSKPKFTSGKWYTKSPHMKKIYTIGELKALGLTIHTQSAGNQAWRSKQQVIHYITKISYYSQELNKMPNHTFAWYHVVYNMVLLVGPNTGPGGRGFWCDVKTGKPLYNHPENQNINKEIEIDEMPFIITDDNLVVCLENGDDSNVTGFAGERRKGKSWGMHNYLLQEKYYNDELVFVVNDSENETGMWCQPWQHTSTFRTELKKMNMSTLPAPIVYLQPLNHTVSRVFRGEHVGRLVTLSWEDIIDPDFFEELFPNLGASKEYIKRLIYDEEGNIRPDGLDSVSSIQEITALIENTLNDKRGMMIQKLKTYFVNIFNTKQIDINTGVPSKWTIKWKGKKESYTDAPWIILMLAGIIPVFQSNVIRGTPYYYVWMKKMLESVYYNQKKNPLFFDNALRVNLFIDEIEDLLSNEGTNKVLNTMVKESGPANIGITWVGQNYAKFPSNFRQNTTHLFAYNQIKENATKIVEDYGVEKAWVKKLTSLQKFECIMLTKNEFVVYDLTRGTKYKSRGPFKGKILPPLSRHSKPNEKPPASISLDDYYKRFING